MRDEFEELAAKYNISTSAIKILARALQEGNGTMAQFNHPELGGMGQWMPGFVMIGDMMNLELKARIDALCTDLINLISSKDNQPMSPTKPTRPKAQPFTSINFVWWASSLGTPTASGSQNNMSYAYFGQEDILAIRLNDTITYYDAAGYKVTGVSQQQSGGRGILIVNVQQGEIAISSLQQIDYE